MKASLSVTVMICVVAVGCGKKTPAPTEIELREAGIVKCVDGFKAGLVRLSKEHSELATVEHFKTTCLGFTFVNDRIEPRVHIALSVTDQPLSELAAVPVSYQEFADIPAVIGFELDCEGNPELKAEIRKLYQDFKVSLRAELGTQEVQPGDLH